MNFRVVLEFALSLVSLISIGCGIYLDIFNITSKTSSIEFIFLGLMIFCVSTLMSIERKIDESKST